VQVKLEQVVFCLPQIPLSSPARRDQRRGKVTQVDVNVRMLKNDDSAFKIIRVETPGSPSLTQAFGLRSPGMTGGMLDKAEHN
jgi:hypothetical protein